jgi:hypothetical protein
MYKRREGKYKEKNTEYRIQYPEAFASKGGAAD